MEVLEERVQCKHITSCTHKSSVKTPKPQCLKLASQSQLSCKRICLQCRKPQFYSWVRKICWRRGRLPTPVFLGFPCGSAAKESACNVGDLSSIPGSGKIPWRRERLLTPVFWPGEFHGLYSPCGLKESERTEQLSLFTLILLQAKFKFIY